MDDLSLMHYGVLGMRWGVRKNRQNPVHKVVSAPTRVVSRTGHKVGEYVTTGLLAAYGATKVKDFISTSAKTTKDSLSGGSKRSKVARLLNATVNLAINTSEFRSRLGETYDTAVNNYRETSDSVDRRLKRYD